MAKGKLREFQLEVERKRISCLGKGQDDASGSLALDKPGLHSMIELEMIDSEIPSPDGMPPLRRLARIVFTTFLLTFITSRVVVILIMARIMPDFFLHMGQTHVHHLNYGIFMLQVGSQARLWCAVAYGFSMALTFDEFGMWLHLGGGYWQRASFDAVIVVLSLFGMLAFAPPLARMRTHHWVTGGALIVLTALFYMLLFRSLNYAGRDFGPRFHALEENGPQ
jgi:hypothetical protein